jgi:hypothetical protein
MPQTPTTIDVLGQQLQKDFGNISQLLGSVLTGLSGEIEAQVKQEIVRVFGDTDFDSIISVVVTEYQSLVVNLFA